MICIVDADGVISLTAGEESGSTVLFNVRVCYTSEDEDVESTGAERILFFVKVTFWTTEHVRQSSPETWR